MIPNGLGILFGIVQLALYSWAKKQEKLHPVQATDDGFLPIDVSHSEIIREDSVGSLGIIQEHCSAEVSLVENGV
jgi:hypothetical protein